MMADALPHISILMPVYNEAQFIDKSLGAILAQDYPAELVEILIADGMSTDETVARIRALSASDRVHVLANPQRRQSAGLNLLLQVAQGEVLVRVDGHTCLAPDYLQRCVAALRATGADEVGGGIAAVGLTTTGRAIAAASRSAFAVPGAFHAGAVATWTDTVYLGAWPRQVLLALGGYAEDLRANEDYELNYRLRLRGGRIWFDPAIRSSYYGRQTFAALWNQYLQYGRAKATMLRRHPASLRLRQAVAPLFVAFGVLCPVMAIMFRPLVWVWLGVLALYMVLCCINALRATRQRESVLQILLAFVVMHTGWGTGFWWGVCDRTQVAPASASLSAPSAETRIG